MENNNQADIQSVDLSACESNKEIGQIAQSIIEDMVETSSENAVRLIIGKERKGGLFSKGERCNHKIKPVKKAVIPAAGFGTRFLPVTKALPKEMLPIVDTPSIHYVVKEAVDSGITEILIILSRGKNCIEDYFDKSVELEKQLQQAKKTEYLKLIREISSMANIQYTRQKEMRGSGWAVHYAKSFVGNEPFAVLFGDDIIYTTEEQKPVTAQLIEAYYTTGTSILGVQRIQGEEIRKYGVVIPGETNGRLTEVKGIIEKPQGEIPSQLTSLGRFILTPDIFRLIEKTPKKNGEVYLTDSMSMQAQTKGVYAYEFEGRRYDIGDKQGFLEAGIEFALRDEKLKDRLKEYLKNLVANL